jgi:hypothetical protein
MHTKQKMQAATFLPNLPFLQCTGSEYSLARPKRCLIVIYRIRAKARRAGRCVIKFDRSDSLNVEEIEMKDKRNLHMRVQEQCDCYLTADPLKEMSLLHNDTDKEEAALKWLGLAVLYGIDSHAKKVSISKGKDGRVSVSAKYRETELPSPGGEIGAKIIESAREIAHIEERAGSIPLAVGIKDSNIELDLRVERDGSEETVTIRFPE